MLADIDTPPSVVTAPSLHLSVRPQPEAYYGLLTNPSGAYGRAPYGASIAYTLRGNEQFIQLAHTLFDNFGGEVINGPRDGTGKRWLENRPVVLRSTPNPTAWFFCMPEERFRLALRTYLYCQMYRHHAKIQVVVDEDGDRVDSICLNEAELEREAAVLADTFYHYEVRPDYGALPEYRKAEMDDFHHDIVSGAGHDVDFDA